MRRIASCQFLSRFWGMIFSLLLFSLPIMADAAEPVKIGVLAFRPKDQTMAQWRVLGEVLKKAIPDRDFSVEAFGFEELEAVVDERHLDFVLSNPGFYAILTKKYGLTAPLAMLSIWRQGHAVGEFGGVIFTRSDTSSINELIDLKGAAIAATSIASFGGYQTQARELIKAGLDLSQDISLQQTGMPHDKVVAEVLSGRAQVGFVRTGVLESMAHEGRLDLARIKVLNPQSWPRFPFSVSTRLYPEWPMVAMPQVDADLKRRVTAVLLSLPEQYPDAAREMAIQGFVTPADYTQVAELLHELRMPPFDSAPDFTWQDVFCRYRWEIGTGLVAISMILLLALRLKFLNAKIEKQAFYDALTGLPNRRFLESRLLFVVGQAKRFRRSMALMFLDLDGFKSINDKHGHDVGDELLKQIGLRLTGCVREIDTVGRTGGDEFVIILSEISSRGDAVAVAEKIIEAVQKVLVVNSHDLHISTSIGVIIYSGNGLKSAEDLLKDADAAMYAAKREGKNRYVVAEADK